jgi:hypothetical protein
VSRALFEEVKAAVETTENEDTKTATESNGNEGYESSRY